MPHKHKAWIVIADGAHARLVSAGADRHFHTIDTIKAGSHGNHGQPDPQSSVQRLFATRIADRVNQLVATENFDDLFLVAPAHMLADITHHLGSAATAKLKTSLHKDLTRVPDGDLPSHFPDWPLVLAA